MGSFYSFPPVLASVSCEIAADGGGEKETEEKREKTLDFIPKGWYNTKAKFHTEWYRSGYNGPDSKSESLFGSLQPEIPCM